MPTIKPGWISQPLSDGGNWQPDEARASELCENYDIQNQDEIIDFLKRWRRAFLDQRHLVQKPRSNAVRKNLEEIKKQAEDLQRNLTAFAEIETAYEVADQILEIIKFKETQETPINLTGIGSDTAFQHIVLDPGLEFRMAAKDLDEIVDLACERLAHASIDRGGRTPIHDVRILVRLVADYWKKILGRGHPKSEFEIFDWDDFSNFTLDASELIGFKMDENKIQTALSELRSEK